MGVDMSRPIVAHCSVHVYMQMRCAYGEKCTPLPSLRWLAQFDFTGKSNFQINCLDAGRRIYIPYLNVLITLKEEIVYLIHSLVRLTRLIHSE